MVQNMNNPVEEYGDIAQRIIDRIRNENIMFDTNSIEYDEYIEQVMLNEIMKEAYIYPSAAREIFELVKQHLYGGYGVIEKLINNEFVNEIMINGPRDIFYEHEGKIQRYNNWFLSTEELEALIRKFAADVHREINEANPIVDARTKEGYRINGILRNVAIDGPVLTIRKFKEDNISFDEMLRNDTFDPATADLLYQFVAAKYNIFISGGTSSGKTTMLGALCNKGISDEERVIIIEDSAELNIDCVENLVRLECRSANALGNGAVNMSDLIKTSLRMRPDRIIVGEVRGKEVVDMIQAMNTGHDGSLSTGHGNSIAGMLARLEAMYMMGAPVPISAIRSQISNAIDVMVHMTRGYDGRRKVAEVAELLGFDEDGYQLNYLITTDEYGGVTHTNNRIQNVTKLRNAWLDDYVEL